MTVHAIDTVDPTTPARDRARIDNPTAEVLRQMGLSRKRWNTMDDTQRLNAMLARIERDRAKREALRGMPQEPSHVPGEDAPVIYFVKTYGGTARYEYAAIHVTGRGWIITSQQRLGHISWTDLLQFAMLREDVDYDPGFYVVNGWAALPKAE